MQLYATETIRQKEAGISTRSVPTNIHALIKIYILSDLVPFDYGYLVTIGLGELGFEHTVNIACLLVNIDSLGGEEPTPIV